MSGGNEIFGIDQNTNLHLYVIWPVRTQKSVRPGYATASVCCVSRCVCMCVCVIAHVCVSVRSLERTCVCFCACVFVFLCMCAQARAHARAFGCVCVCACMSKFGSFGGFIAAFHALQFWHCRHSSDGRANQESRTLQAGRAEGGGGGGARGG